MPKNPKLWICVQTRSTFNALILKEGCYAGQIPQACLGPREDNTCVWRPDKLPAPSRQRKKAKRDQETMNNRIYFPASFLAWAPLSTRHTSHNSGGHETQAILSLLCRTEGTLFALTSLFSLCLFSLKG